MKIFIITWPLGSNAIGIKIATNFISQLLTILQPIADEIIIISQNLFITDSSLFQNTNVINVGPFNDSANSLIRILNYARYQVQASLMISKLEKDIDIVLLYGGSSLLLPNLIAHLYSKKSCIFAQGPDFNITKISFPTMSGLILAKIIKIIDQLNWRLANKIIVQSKSQIEFEGMNNLENKVSATGMRYIDFNKFKPRKTFSERDKLIGYIGTLGAAKGVLEFVEALPLILNMDPDIAFLIGGDGDLLGNIEKRIKQLRIENKVEIVGWISHEVLPEYLNNLRLLILPSYTEGLPTIVLEAMACGTPVLATSVGGIPDMIEDRKTGFILHNNSPECIAEGAITAVNYPTIEEICSNAHALVEQKLGLNMAIKIYRETLSELTRS